jgi:hypothetical protein
MWVRDTEEGVFIPWYALPDGRNQQEVMSWFNIYGSSSTAISNSNRQDRQDHQARDQSMNAIYLVLYIYAICNRMRAIDFVEVMGT